MEHRGRTDGDPPPEDDATPLRDELRPRGPVQFDVTVTKTPGCVRLRIRGELDVLTIPRLAAELNTAVRRATEDVIVDLRETTFLDSAGLQILLGTQRRLTHASRRLTVVCDDGPVRRVIELTRTGDTLGLVGGGEAGEG